MKNIKAIIRKDVKTKDKEYLIYIRYTYNRRYILFSTDNHVLLKNWKPNTGRIKKSFNYEKLNTNIEQFENKIITIILDIKIKDEEPTLLNVKNEYYNLQNHSQQIKSGSKKINEKLFLSDFQDFIDDRVENNNFRDNTIKAYKTTLNKLKEFKKTKGYFLHYNTINETFYFAFVNYMRYDEGLLDNSLDKHIKNLKLFMNYSFEKKKHTNLFFQTFKRTRAKSDFVVLNRKELIDLAYNYKPKIGSLKDRIRDTFIFGCSTGLRFGDLVSLTKGNFVIKRDGINNKILDNSTDTYIWLTTIKTNEQLKLPISNFIFDLIKKYDLENNEPTFLKHNNQVFNRTIKDICKEIGFTEMTKLSKKKGKADFHSEKMKYEFISSYTMRRTFITQMSNSTEITNVQAVTGHKNINILTDYIKRNDKELNVVKANLNDIFYEKDENLIGDKSSGINTRIIVK